MDRAVARLPIGEIGSVVDDLWDQYNENDFFGLIYTNASPPGGGS
jgi:hypothetical protein